MGQFQGLLHLCILCAIFGIAKGYPEIGFIAKLTSDITRSSTGWSRVTGWTTTVSDTFGFYQVGSIISNNAGIEIPVSGIYFVAIAIAIDNADSGGFRAALARDGRLTESGIALRSEIRDLDGSKHSLDFSGFVNLRAGEMMEIYAWSSLDTGWKILSQSTFSMHFVGVLGSNPGFMINLKNDTSVAAGSFQRIQPWTTTTKSNHYGKSSGIQEQVGLVDSLCAGAYLMAANVIVEGPAGKYQLTSVVNGTKTTVAIKVTTRTSRFTLNLAQGLKLDSGATLELQVHANVSGSSLLATSQWSMQYVGEVLQLNREFASFLTEPISGSGSFFKKIEAYISNATVPGEFVEPANLALVQRTNFLLSNEAEFYYVMANLHVSGASTNLEFMIAVSANAFISNGKEGPYTRVSKLAGETASVAFGGVLYVQKDEYISVFVRATDGKAYTVSQNSYISIVKMRYTLSSFSALISPTLKVTRTGWVELNQNWITTNHGLHKYTQDFSASQGRFTASFSGIYQLSTNILFESVSTSSPIAITAAVDGKINTRSGLYSTNSKPSSGTTLHVYGSIFLASGSYISIFASSESDLDYFIGQKSTFSLSLIGPVWAIPGFYAVLSNTISRNDAQSLELGSWTTQELGLNLYHNDNNFDQTYGRYTVPETAIYAVSANILIQNGTHASSGLIDVEARVDGQSTISIGLHDKHPTYSVNDRGELSLTFSGVLQVERGSNISLFVIPDQINSYVIAKESSFTVVRWCGVTSPPAYGFRSFSLATANIENKENQWIGIKSMLSRTLDNGVVKIQGGFTLGAGYTTQQATDRYTVQEPGVYFISGNFLLDRAASTTFEFALQINTLETSIVLYAKESQPKGQQYVLSFAGTLYLLTGQSLRIVVKSSSSMYDIKEGSAFSVIKLQLDEKNPGFSVSRNYGRTNVLQTQDITGYEVHPVPKLFISNVGFKSQNGSYTVRTTGVYLSSASVVLQNSGSAGTTSLAMVKSDDRRQIISGGGTVGSDRTILITRSVYLLAGATYKSVFNATSAYQGSMLVSWTIYFMQTSLKVTGISGSLSAETTVPTGWTQIFGWQSDNTSFPSTNPNQVSVYSHFLAPYQSVYHATFLAEFRNVAANSEISHAVYINSTLAFESKWTTSTDTKISIPISASIKLQGGDNVTFRAKSSSGQAILTPLSSMSIVDLRRVIEVQEGFLAYQPDPVTTGNTLGVSTVLTNWVTSGRPGTFIANPDSQTGNGTFVMARSGFYQISANLLVENTQNLDRVFYAQGVLSQESDVPENLFTQQSITGTKIGTLSISTIVRLERLTAFQLLIRSGDNLAFRILAGSTLSMALIDDSGIPQPCYQSNLAVQDLSPAYKRIMIEKTFSFVCNVIGQFPVSYTWFKNSTVITGETTKTLLFNGTQKSNSDTYRCRVQYQTQVATTNDGVLSVYDPTPTIVPEHAYSVVVQEGSGMIPLLESFLVGAEKFAPGKAIIRAVITAGDPRGEFVMSNDSTTTVSIGTTRSLDYETQRFYSLTITAVNTEEPEARNISIIFNVTVLDINDHPPVFNVSLINKSYPEDLPIGSFIAQVNATDIESGVNGLITYSIVGNTSTPFFEINNATGLITLKATLDREQEDEHVIIVTARNGIFLAVAVLTVNVTDVNDNRPQFRETSFNLDIVESTPVATSVLEVYATDIDLGQNAQIRYRLGPISPANHFALDPVTGILTVASTLDYESVTRYNLVIQAYDLGVPVQSSSPNVTVVINILDFNDNIPKFQSSLYQKTLLDNSPAGTFVVKVIAGDADATSVNNQVHFIIPHSNASEYFQISSDGNITLKRQVDFEVIKQFQFTVVAKDSGNASLESTTTVLVTITDTNDNDPVLEPLNYHLNLSEFTPVGTSVLRVTGKDADSMELTRLRFSMLTGNSDGYFLLTSNGDLFVAKELDRETKDLFQLTVTVTDGTNTAPSDGVISIRILDENDIRPTFPQHSYTASVSEDASIGTSILTVRATDTDLGDNSRITYSILVTSNNPSSSLFAINESTGVLTVASALDFETQKYHYIYVRATDHGRVPLTSVVPVAINVTDVLDNTLQFDSSVFNVSIPESFPIGSFVTRLIARDRVTQQTKDVRYSITDGIGRDRFTIDNVRGTISLAKLLDYESQRQFTLTIMARDILQTGVNITTTVVVTVLEVNDNRPVALQSYYSTIIIENATVGSSVLRINATDADLGQQNRMLNFSIASNSTDFVIDRDTGVITTANSLDYDRQRVYSLVIQVSDRGSPYLTASTLVDIFIAKVNKAPVFTVQTYNATVSERTLIGSLILLIRAYDNDPGAQGSLSYAINDELTNSNTFYVSSNGNVYLNTTLDYETKQIYQFTISARDNGQPSLQSSNNALITINVLDVNDNQPIFDLNRYTRQLSEGTFQGTILSVRATDRDGTSDNSNIFYSIVPSQDAGNFTINDRTGAITSTVSFDREAVDNYHFEVEAKDTGRNNLTGRAMVVVYITDVNDNPPVPFQAVYTVNISETILVGREILTITATDRDQGENSRLSFVVISGETNKFAVERDTGKVIIRQSIYTSQAREYRLNVVVTDNGAPSLNSSVLVIIKVSPYAFQFRFQRDQYIFRVPEGTIRSPLGQIVATDGAANTTSTYQIYNAGLMNISGIFSLNSVTGEITMLVPLDYETRAAYDFSVEALSNRGRNAYSHVRVIVEDVNEMPFFIGLTNGQYIANVSEHVQVGSYLLKVTAEDNDTLYTNNAALEYSLLLPAGLNGKFSIDTIGRIILQVPLDYESVKSYVFQAFVTDRGSPRLNATTTIVLNVMDYNDNSPVFLSIVPNNVSIEENSSIGKFEFLLTAVDQDSGENSRVTYPLVIPPGILRADEVTGMVYVNTSLDYEKVQKYEILFVAEDHGVPGPLRVSKLVTVNIVNINDNKPVFNPTSYLVTVIETAAIGTIVTAVLVSDDDFGVYGHIRRYEITSGNVDNTFRVDNLGHVVLSKALNFIAIKSYTLTIQAYDGGTPALNANTPATVNIIVREFAGNQPSFILNTYDVSITENMAAPAFIVNVTATTENVVSGPIEYSLAPGNDSQFFHVNNATGVISSKGSFDYEQRRQYTFSVIATDKAINQKGHCHVVVRILDLNDNRPQFTSSKTFFNISEAASIGAVIHGFAATDADDRFNGQVVFSGGNIDGLPGMFVVNQDGTLFLEKSLDHQVKNNYTVLITATDRGNPPLSNNLTITMLVIRAFPVAENKIDFLSANHTVYVDEGLTVAQLVNTTAVVRGGEASVYKLEGAAEEIAPFSVNPMNGTVSLNVPLDYEQKNQYNFLVTATASEGAQAYTLITVIVRELNDNGPVFEPSNYTSTISEVTRVGAWIAQLTVKDNDTDTTNTPYTYSIINGDPNSLFRVENTGLVRLNKEIDLEAPGQRQLMVLTVRVLEGQRSSTATVYVRILDDNDVIPLFRNVTYSFTVPENSVVDSEIGIIRAYDNDISNPNNVFSYTLLNNNGQFKVTSTGNEAKIAVNGLIDYELQDYYELAVLVSDRGTPTLQSVIAVRINVTDLNDNAPVFTSTSYNNSIRERTPVGTTVATVFAYDADAGNFGQVNYILTGPSMFYVDQGGNVILSGNLDHEGQTSFDMTVAAIDGGGKRSSNSAVVTIKVIEVNDNQPQFSMSYYYFTIYESTPSGTNIGTVVATDSDRSGNSVIYSIVPAQESNPFSVSASTGNITVSGILDYDNNTTRKLTFSVKAVDAGNFTLESRARVVVYLTDVNDNTPVITPALVTVNISELTPVGSAITVLSATDIDSGVNSRITWVSFDTSNTFIIDNLGVVRLRTTLYYDQRNLYVFTVQAKDGGSPQRHMNATVTVNVSKYLLEQPIFLQKHYEVTINENVPIGTLVTQLNYTRTFNRRGLPILLTIKDPSRFPEFSTNNNSKQVNVAGPGLDYERQRRYDFALIISNALGYMDVATVTVHVLNLNEHAPYFELPNYNITISELAIPGYTAIQLVGNDNDTGAIGLQYQLISGNGNRDFLLDGDRLIVNQTFQQAMYTFNVSVRDPGGLLGYSTVVVHIRPENQPKFSNETYIVTVYENIAIRTSILQVSAGSLLRGIVYTIEDPVANNTFSMNNGNGIIRNIVTLNYENTKQYIFPIMAKVTTPVPLSDVATVVVNVLDVNDVGPSFYLMEYETTISELHPVGSRVISLNYTDRDTNPGLTFLIQSGNTGGYFSIDNRGHINLVSSIVSVRNTQNLNVTLFDGFGSASTKVKINIISRPRCSPEFENSLYVYNVYENATIGSYLTRPVRLVNISTPATTYSISNGNLSPTWMLNASGYLVLKQNLDFERETLYTSEVFGTNLGFTGQAAVVIHVLNVNDEPPRVPGFYYVSISERSIVGIDVLTINATDLDTPTLDFSILSGNQNNAFALSSGGTLFLNRPLDYEGIRRYDLRIAVSDQRVIVFTRVFVNVLDVTETVICNVNSQP